MIRIGKKKINMIDDNTEFVDKSDKNTNPYVK